MATRSRIGILHKDGSILAHYCHSDGYFSHNGRILEDHWQNRAAIQKLIDLGDMSVLGPKLGKKHDFDWRSGYEKAPGEDYAAMFDRINQDERAEWCLFYKRDRGEKGDLKPKRYASIHEFAASGDAEEFLYLWDENRGCWIGCATPYQGSVQDYQFHLLSDLKAADWEDGRDDDGENPKVRVIPLFESAAAVALPSLPVAANDPEPIDMDDPAARAIF